MKCGVRWASCSPSPTQFGKPGLNPHECMGDKGHASKLHVCYKCGVIGHPIEPTRFSAAGLQLAALKRAANTHTNGR